jgi:large subunit ribosomal protein L25
MGRPQERITMDKIQLKAEKRDLKANLRKLRKQDVIPAVLYGNKVPNINLLLNSGEFEKTFRKAGESTIIEVEVVGEKTFPVLIHDVQYHVLTSKPIHVDFFAINMTEKLKTKIALEFIGESKAIKAGGGVLVKSMTEVEVECLPNDLPHNIEVDISKLENFTDSIQVKDLKVNSKVTILANPEEVIAKVQPPRDVEAELVPVVEDISKVEGAAEDKPVATEGDKKETKTEPKKE